MTRYLITSALPYINGIKHLGNLAGSLLPADIYARFLRQQGETVLFICGTDEHGTPAELAAQAKGQDVKSYCDTMYEIQKDIYDAFGISCDYFGRSSDPENHATTQAIFKALDEHGYIEERTTQQVYSKADQRFLPDRYVVGECPHCHDPNARGDQCDQCGRLLDPTELIHPRSAISQSDDLEIKDSKHLYLKLDALEPLCHAWLKTTTPHWPVVSQGIAHKWLQEGLQPRCISRDLSWGVPIPKPGYEKKVFYVWFDAPIAYISITKSWCKQAGEDWTTWWQPSDPTSVQYTQFMAKDNVPFHAVFWPSMLLGSQQPWKMVDTIKAVNWLTYEGGKFSTSHQRGVFTDTALTLFPADYWRYYLASISPESSDSDFSFAQLAQMINKDLADTLGNFIGRVTTLIQKYADGKVPAIASRQLPDSLEQAVRIKLKELDDCLRSQKFRQAIQTIKQIWMIGNEYITQQQPWAVAKNDLDAAQTILFHCLILIRVSVVAAASIIPDTAEKIFSLLHQQKHPKDVPFSQALDASTLPSGHPIDRSQALIQKISDEEVAELTERFKGQA